MRTKAGLLAISCVVALVVPAAAQQEKLGKVTFPTSCDAKVQAQFERGVAMLHSYWFTEARKVFEAVIAAGPELRDRVLGAGRRTTSAIRWRRRRRRRTSRPRRPRL